MRVGWLGCCAALLLLSVATADEEPNEPCQIPRDATREEKCEYITDNDDACDVDSLIDYLEVYYCSNVSQGAAYAFMVAFVAWWWLLIAVLGSTADEYFCPPLTCTASWLQLRPRVAAVTLLALANGAPDIFSVQAALQQGDTLLAVGAMLGGTLFVTFLVVPAVIFCSTDAVLAGGMLFRDVGSFCVVVGLVAGLFALGNVYVWQPCVLLGLYVLYVAVVANSHRISPMRWTSESAPLLAPATAEAEARPPRRGSVNDPMPRRLDEQQSNFCAEACEMTEWTERSAFERALYMLEAPFRVARTATIPTFITPEELDDADVKAGRTMADKPVLVSCAEKVAIAVSALGFPCLVTVWVQAEILDDDFETNVNGIPLVGFVAVVATPFVGWLTILLWRSPDSCGFGFHTRHHVRVYEDVGNAPGVAGSQARYISAGLSSTLPHWLHRMLMVGSLIGAVIWIDMVSGEVVALLQSFGFIFDVPAALLGQTALAWGNSVGDAFANAALARQGHTKMAITGCFAAPLFNVLCGFGVALLIECIKVFPAPFTQDVRLDPLLGNALAFQAGGLMILLVVAACSKFVVGKAVAAALVSLYACFLTLCLLIGFGVIA